MAIVNETEIRSYSAISKINNTNVMAMSANYNAEPGSISFNQSILDLSVYEANKEEADADYESWKADILANLPVDTE